MEAAFSSLLGPGTVSVAGGRRRSRFNIQSSSCFPGMVIPMSNRRRMQKTVKAVLTANPESVCPYTCNLFPSFSRDQSSSAAAVASDDKKKKREEQERNRRDSVTQENLDCWIRESIGEIVRNIGEAPFLVHIFSNGTSLLRLEREAASSEHWPLIKKRWDQGSCMPDGVVLVEELKDEEEEEAGSNRDDNDARSSRTWGLVVQGRGMDCAASCYILNTCRVRSAAGFCTHFCLVRAKCFGETLEKQLSKAWLQAR